MLEACVVLQKVVYNLTEVINPLIDYTHRDTSLRVRGSLFITHSKLSLFVCLSVPCRSIDRSRMVPM